MINHFFIFLPFLVYFNPEVNEQKNFKDFDYKLFSPVDAITDLNHLPNYYIACDYTDNRISAIKVFDKRVWSKKISENYISVTYNYGGIVLNYGSGKVQNSYGNEFPARVYQTDSAFLIKDTLLFKSTNKNRIRVQYYTNINSDSIVFKEKTYPFVTKKGIQNSPLSNFSKYKEWFSLDDKYASELSNGILNINSQTDTLMRWEGFYKYHYPITRSAFKEEKMPISLFWLKHSGALR